MLKLRVKEQNYDESRRAREKLFKKTEIVDVEKGKRSYNMCKKYSKLIFYVVLVKILNAELYKTFLLTVL